MPFTFPAKDRHWKPFEVGRGGQLWEQAPWNRGEKAWRVTLTDGRARNPGAAAKRLKWRIDRKPRPGLAAYRTDQNVRKRLVRAWSRGQEATADEIVQGAHGRPLFARNTGMYFDRNWPVAQEKGLSLRYSRMHIRADVHRLFRKLSGIQTTKNSPEAYRASEIFNHLYMRPFHFVCPQLASHSSTDSCRLASGSHTRCSKSMPSQVSGLGDLQIRVREHPPYSVHAPSRL